MARTTTAYKTLNPLHFEDLEPHRFEDLVRQLTYQFRSWRMIEATGRLGADDGIDIRAIETGGEITTDPSGDESENSIQPSADRIWIIQCKREKKLGPKDVRSVVDAAIPGGADPPYGFVLAAACDFSMKARNSFREHAISKGVAEVHVWGKAELEDMLFLPANDHLLFAYFNISLQIRRRLQKTELRARLAMKRTLIRVLGDIQNDANLSVLLRDPRETRYPLEASIPDFAQFPRWRRVQFDSHNPPDHLCFIIQEHLAYVDDEREHWDAMLGFADKPGGLIVGIGYHHEKLDPEFEATKLRHRNYWLKHVPTKNRATLEVLRIIHYDRVIAVDEHGDIENEGVHLLVEFDREHGPFEPGSFHRIECFNGSFRFFPNIGKESRVAFFPDEIPNETDILTEPGIDTMNPGG